MNPMYDPAKRDAYIETQKSVARDIVIQLRAERRQEAEKTPPMPIIVGVLGPVDGLQAVDQNG